MQHQGVGSALALVGVLCLTSLALAAAAATEEDRRFEVTNADPAQAHQQGGDDRSKIQTRHSPAQLARGEEEERGPPGVSDGPGGENPRLRASRKQEVAAEGDERVDEQGEAPPKERRTPEKNNKRAKEEERSSPRKVEQNNPAADALLESAAPSFHDVENLGSPESSNSRDPAEIPAEDDDSRKWHVSTDAQAAIPLFGDLQQFTLPRLGAAQFPGFPSRPSLLGRSDLVNPREADGSSPPSNLFDFPRSTIPFFSFGDVPRTGEPSGVPPLVHWLPILGGDWRLPSWLEFGSAGRLKNITIGLPGFGNLGILPFGTLAEIPVFPTLSDLLQDPLNVEQLQSLFTEALKQIQEDTLNAEKLKDIVDEIVRRVTPQESFVVKQIVRAHKERDASRARGLAEALLEAASRVGQQLKVLKEVSVGGTMTPGGEVSACVSNSTVLGDLKEVLDIEEAFTHFRAALEQLLAPLLSILQGFSPFNWAVPSLA